MNGGGQGARLPFFVVSVAAPPELPPAFPLRSSEFVACVFSRLVNSVGDPSLTLHPLGLACRDSAAYGCLGSPVCPTTTWATLTIIPDMTSGISYVSLFLFPKNKK